MRLPALAFAALLSGCAAAKAPAPPASTDANAPVQVVLDGTRWRITAEPLDPDAKDRPFEDLLAFSSGRERQLLLDSFLKTRQFAPASYSTPWGGEPKPGDPVVFEATLNNPSGESLQVEGRASRDAVWGQIRLRREDWSLAAWRFRGTPAR